MGTYQAKQIVTDILTSQIKSNDYSLKRREHFDEKNKKAQKETSNIEL